LFFGGPKGTLGGNPMKGFKTKIRNSNRKLRLSGFRTRSKTRGGRKIIRRKRRRRGRFV